jgi:preprotein translocase subunit YajC
MLLPLVVMLAFMYFFVLRPEQKRAKEREVTLKALMKGDIVRTNGGIRGEIVSFANDNRDVILEIAPKTRINVFRTQILGKDAPSTDAASPSSSDKADKADKKKD